MVPVKPGVKAVLSLRKGFISTWKPNFCPIPLYMSFWFCWTPRWTKKRQKPLQCEFNAVHIYTTLIHCGRCFLADIGQDEAQLWTHHAGCPTPWGQIPAYVERFRERMHNLSLCPQVSLSPRCGPSVFLHWYLTCVKHKKLSTDMAFYSLMYAML